MRVAGAARRKGGQPSPTGPGHVGARCSSRRVGNSEPFRPRRKAGAAVPAGSATHPDPRPDEWPHREGSRHVIVLHVAMSLDGFIAGPSHDMSWTGGAEYATTSSLADEVARRTGAILAGRGWYEVASGDEGGAVAGIYGGAWSGPVVVVTHRPDDLAADDTVGLLLT